MFKVGDIVKFIDLKILVDFNASYIPSWYSTESFEVIAIGVNEIWSETVFLDRDLKGINEGPKNRIWSNFLELDIITMRKKKLEKLKQIGEIYE